MSENVKIRLADESDLEKINNLYKEVVTDLLDVKKIDMLWRIDGYPFCEFQYDIKDKNMYVIEDEGKIVGGFSLTDIDDPDYENIEWKLTKEGKYFYVNRLAILPSMQNKGYATMSINFLDEYAKQNDYEGIRLVVYDQNKIAINLYKKFGFVQVQKGNHQFEGKVYIGYEKSLNKMK